MWAKKIKQDSDDVVFPLLVKKNKKRACDANRLLNELALASPVFSQFLSTFDARFLLFFLFEIKSIYRIYFLCSLTGTKYSSYPSFGISTCVSFFFGVKPFSRCPFVADALFRFTNSKFTASRQNK